MYGATDNKKLHKQVVQNIRGPTAVKSGVKLLQGPALPTLWHSLLQWWRNL